MHFSSTTALFLAAASLLTLAGCSTDDTDAALAGAVETPQEWRNRPTAGDALDAAGLANWWTRFNDPVLEKLVASALADSPDIRTALSRIAESRARYGISQSALLPALSGKLGAREDYNRNRNTHTTISGDSYTAGLDASWEIDLFGKNSASLDAAGADIAQMQENYYAAQVSLSAEVAAAYIALRTTEAQLVVVNRNLETRLKTTQLTQWRKDAGEGDGLDTRQSLSTAEQTRAAIPSLQNTISQARNQLALLCGKTPGALDEILAPTNTLPAAPATLAIGIPADSLRNRPDIRAAGKAFEAAAFRKTSAERERFPTLNLTGSIGIEALRAGKLFSPDATIGSIAAGLVQPIYAGGRISQNIELQTELQKQALLAYESAVLTALGEVENALVAIQRTGERLAILKTAADAAEIATTFATQKFKTGETDLTTVLDTQRTQLSIEDQYVSTAGDNITAYVQLYKALGGGWTPAKETPNNP